MMRAKKKFTKAKKNDALEKIARYLSGKLIKLKEDGVFTYSEIAEFSGLLHPRISELTRKNVLPERTLVGLVSGGFVTTDEIFRELKGKLDEGQQKYVKSFAVYEMTRLRSLILGLIENGVNPEKELERVYREKLGDDKLKEVDRASATE